MVSVERLTLRFDERSKCENFCIEEAPAGLVEYQVQTVLSSLLLYFHC